MKSLLIPVCAILLFLAPGPARGGEATVPAGGVVVSRPAPVVPRPTAGRDSVSELSTQEQLRLQSAADRQAKAQTTLSNVQKKQADTQQTVISNMK